MKLSENFTLSELTKSEYAIRNDLLNMPDESQIVNLKMLCEKVLQPIRDHFDRPVIISSGYRSKILNMRIGGSKTSDHCKGFAADIEVPGISNYELAVWIRNNLQFKQVILEFYRVGDPDSGWVHVSYDPADLKMQALTAFKRNGEVLYLNGLVM